MAVARNAKVFISGAAPTISLVEQVARAVSIPIIASGGFATGARLIAALALGAPVRVLLNWATDALGTTLTGHMPDRLPRAVIAQDAGGPQFKCSTDSPLRKTTGNLQAKVRP